MLTFALSVSLLQGVGGHSHPVIQPVLDSMFQGGAVLQRDVDTAVWGTSKDKHVQLQLISPAGKTAVDLQVPVNASGIWLTYLPPQTAGYGYKMLASDSNDNTSVQISFGENLLCVGQSNMGMQVGPSERAFDADNCTAESAAAGRYTGKIFLHARSTRYENATMWYDVTPESIQTFSAVCWLTGRDLWFHMGEKIPVGLLMNAVGAHHIEHWLGPNQVNACVAGRPPCLPAAGNSQGWSKTIVPMHPFTIGTMIWDQGEQNVNCEEVDFYECLTHQLVTSYREQFNSSFPFISVQLPGYTNQHQVFPMRVVQDEASLSLDNADTVPTYDDSCAMGKTDGCPHGTVHNVHKQPVGQRLALQVRRMKLGEKIISQGPRLSEITVNSLSEGGYAINMDFKGSGSLHMGPTRNCSICCGKDTISDFDVSSDGKTWYNATPAVTKGIRVKVEVTMPAKPSVVRYTANRVFPQCAVYGEEGIPAMPFQKTVADSFEEPLIV